MKRTHLAVAALALLVSTALTACSKADSETPSAPEPSATETTSKYQTLWGEAGDNLVLPPDSEARSSSEANGFRGLGAETDVQYVAYYFPEKAYGYWCAISDDDTYIAKVIDQGAETILMGEGDCSTTEGDAAVVGDTKAERWTKGADLMGGEKMEPWGTIPIVTEQPDAVFLAVPVDVSLALMEDFATTGTIADLAKAETIIESVDKPKGTRVIGYTTTGKPAEPLYTFCVVNDRTRDWAFYDSSAGQVTDLGIDAENFDQVCTP